MRDIIDGKYSSIFNLFLFYMVKIGMAVYKLRLNYASETSGGRASPDCLGQVYTKCAPMLLAN